MILYRFIRSNNQVSLLYCVVLEETHDTFTVGFNGERKMFSKCGPVYAYRTIEEAWNGYVEEVRESTEECRLHIGSLRQRLAEGPGVTLNSEPVDKLTKLIRELRLEDEVAELIHNRLNKEKNVSRMFGKWSV